jgi:hypothetical protein
MAAFIVYGVAVYLIIGVVFAIAFAMRGAHAIDAGARGTPWGFKVLILPGAAALWPLMLRKWIAVRHGPVQGEHA